MNATTQQKTNIPRDEIARTAWLLWKSEGCPPGRDQEYWFKAEQRLLTSNKPQKAALITANARRGTTHPSPKKHPVRIWPDVMD